MQGWVEERRGEGKEGRKGNSTGADFPELHEMMDFKSPFERKWGSFFRTSACHKRRRREKDIIWSGSFQEVVVPIP